MIDATITLPAADVIIAQLNEGVQLDPHVSQELFTAIAARLAGEEVVGPGLVMRLMTLIHVYARDNGLTPFTLFIITDFLPSMIEALTPDHPAVREDALKHWKLRQEVKKK